MTDRRHATDGGSDHVADADRTRTDDGLLSPLRRRSFVAGSAAGVAGALAGCSSLGGESADSDATTDLVGELTPSVEEGTVGDPVRLSGESLPANTEVELVWHSVDGRWGLVQGKEIIQPQYTARTDTVATVTTDGNGTFVHEWSFPEDYGGTHRIEVRATDGSVLARTSVRLGVSFEIDRERAAIGETFTVTAHGLGTSGYTSLYEVAWDNGLLGLVTAVSSRGRAEAVVPAAGPPGQHLLRVGRGWTGVFYLNLQQSPYEPPDFPTWVVEVTDPDDPPATGWRDEGGPLASPSQLRDVMETQYSAVDLSAGADLAVTPSVGRVGETVTVEGSGLPANRRIDLVWFTKRGNRVQDGFSTASQPLGTATTDGTGHLAAEVTVPDDLGGLHPISAEVDGEPVGVATFSITPSIVDIEPSAGPVGTEFEVHIKGVGWTEYDNTYALTFDNRFLGYACGFNSQGDVTIPLTAAGQPGFHTIDLYPAVYQGIDEGSMPDFYNKPQLSYRDDHPGRSLPAFHFTFEVTDE